VNQITANKLDHLVTKVTTHLVRVIEEELRGLDGVAMLSETERSAICDQALRDSSVARRVKLHAEVWVDDAVAQAAQIARSKVEGKLRRVAKNSRLGSRPVT
jgi:predicted transcriptional regulator